MIQCVGHRLTLDRNMRSLVCHRRSYFSGQVMIELALIMGFFFSVILLVWKFAFWCVERDVAKYAAFMAARSYQVFGAKEAQDITDGSWEKIYHYTAEKIIDDALPYVFPNGATLSVTIDTSKRNRADFVYIFPDYDRYLQFYEIPKKYLVPVPQHSDVETNSPGFGLLKLELDHEWFLGDASATLLIEQIIFGKHEIFMPYRLESGLKIEGL